MANAHPITIAKEQAARNATPQEEGRCQQACSRRTPHVHVDNYRLQKEIQRPVITVACQAETALTATSGDSHKSNS